MAMLRTRGWYSFALLRLQNGLLSELLAGLRVGFAAGADQGSEDIEGRHPSNSCTASEPWTWMAAR
jgi:hypothetical protein